VVRVLVCADSAVELAGLEALVRSAPSLELAGSCLGKAGLSQQVADTQPDVLLELSLLDGLEASPSPEPEGNSLARVLLVDEPDFTAGWAAIQAAHPAIRGLLPVWASAREIQTAVEAAATGLLVLHPEVAERAAMTAAGPSRAASGLIGLQLSPREREILNLLAAGLGNKQIAWQLKISEHTVKFHVTSIFNKLNVSSRAQAVAVGVRRGLIIL